MPILMGEQFKQVLEANRVGEEDREPEPTEQPSRQITSEPPSGPSAQPPEEKRTA